MPLLPRLTGGVTVRERPARYDGEPRYLRLDFVRPKSRDDSDSWPIVRSTQPIRALQVYEYNPAYAYYGQYPGYHHHPIAHGHQQPRLSQYPAGHPIHHVPAPALTGHKAPKQIEARPQFFEPLDSDDDKFTAIFQEKKSKKGKGKKSRSPSPTGHSIFDSSSSSSESESYHKRKSGRKNKRK